MSLAPLDCRVRQERGRANEMLIWNSKNESKVAQFAQGLPEFTYDGKKPYAEVSGRRCVEGS